MFTVIEYHDGVVWTGNESGCCISHWSWIIREVNANEHGWWGEFYEYYMKVEVEKEGRKVCWSEMPCLYRESDMQWSWHCCGLLIMHVLTTTFKNPLTSSAASLAHHPPPLTPLWVDFLQSCLCLWTQPLFAASPSLQASRVYCHWPHLIPSWVEFASPNLVNVVHAAHDHIQSCALKLEVYL